MRPAAKLLAILALLPLLTGCGEPDIKLDTEIDLRVSFVDSSWDGVAVPYAGRCRDCGGAGMSPALRIAGLPPEAHEVVVEFNDLSFLALSEDGGHGTLAMATGGAAEIVLPSLREESMKLPQGVRSLRKHRCSPYGHEPGAYKAPCGCGQGNVYAATILVMGRAGEKTVKLARTEIALGAF